MRLLRPSAVLAVLLLAPGLAACGGDDGEGADPPAETSSPEQPPSQSETGGTGGSDGGTTSASAPAGELPAACEVLDPEDVAAAYGVGFGAASPGGGGHTEQDVEWQSDNCSWPAEDLMEVTFALSGPDDYPAGFACPEPTAIASTVKPVQGLAATGAWWEVDDSPPLEGTLRVCTEGYNFDVTVELEDGVDFRGNPRNQTIALARAVLEELGG